MIKTIVSVISTRIEANIIESSHSIHDIAEVVSIDGALNPVIHQDGDSLPIVPSSDYAMVIYHRVLKESSQVVEEGGFGDSDEIIHTFDMGLFCFASEKRETGEWIAQDITAILKDALGNNIQYAGSGGEWITVIQSGDVLTGEDVFKTELDGNDPAHLNTHGLILVMIPYNISVRLCGELSNDSSVS